MMAPAGGERPAKTGLWPAPLWLSLAWGFAEATLFFIVPDVVLGWESLGGWRRGQRRRDEILRIVDWLCDKLASKLCALALDPVRVRPCDFPWDPYGAALSLFQYSPGSGNCVTTAMSILMFE